MKTLFLSIAAILIGSNLFSQPYQNRLLIALSSDGLKWEKPGIVFSENGEVPDAILRHDGKIAVYYQGLVTKIKESIFVAISNNGIDNWSRYPIILNGTESWKGQPCDPDIIYFKGKYRLYFTGNPTEGPNPETHSAISDDGINFTLESGVRFSPAGSPVMDPSLIQIGDTLHYFAGGAPGGKNWHAISTDALNFTRISDFQIENLMMANGLQIQNGYRFYCFANNDKKNIFSIYSQDGINWIKDSKSRITLDNPQLEIDHVKDPAVVLKDGNYLMFYVAGNGQIPGNDSLKTSNPNATKEAKCILNYLASLKKREVNKIISGQYTNVALNIENAYQNDIVGLYNKTNKWTGIIGVDYQRVQAGLPRNMHETNKRVIDYYRQGGLVTLFCSFSNPWTNKGFNDTTGRYQIMDIIDSTKPVHREWLKRLDSVANGFKELQDSGVVVLYRFFSENNGFWFWWGSQTPNVPTQENWIKLWKFAHNYFTNVKKLNNILWVFAPSAKESANKNPYFKPDMHYYPGNDFVDIVGTSVYNDTLDIPSYNELKATGKPIALTEFGPGNASRMTHDYDYYTLLKQIKTKYPDFVYWVSWNDFVTNGGKDTVYYSPQNQKNAKQLFEDNWVINRDEIDWQKNCEQIHNDNGPWINPLIIANSIDGINFTNERIFQDSAGVVSAIKWRGDTLVCVFQWFRQPINSKTWDKVAVKFSYNNGKDWTEPVPIIVNGFPDNYQRPFDPTLTVTENNKLRIYFSSSDGIPKGLDSAINTYSAISSDGINFEYEHGARYDNPQQRVIDPAVISFNNEWHYTSPKGAPQDGAFHCTSSDGLNFVRKADILSDNSHNWTGNFLVENENELRFYGCGSEIWFNKSGDGYSWSGYTKTNLKGGDPTVVKLSNTEYIAIFTGAPYGNQGKFTCGDTLIDPRDGKRYATVLIGSDCWMKQNLNFGQMVLSNITSQPHSEMFNNNIPEKYAMANDSTNLKNLGGLYEWDELMNYRKEEASQGLCPPGWHIATDSEWKRLIETSGGKLLDENSGFGGNALKIKGEGFGKGAGTDKVGFSAKHSGDRGGMGEFNGKGLRSIFWTSTQVNPVQAVHYTLWAENDTIQRLYLGSNTGFACRCVKNPLINSVPEETENIIQNNELAISPNPATDYIIVDLGNYPLKGVVENEEIRIFNVFGECVLYVETIHELSLQKIDISALSAGVYFVKIGEKVSKFVKI